MHGRSFRIDSLLDVQEISGLFLIYTSINRLHACCMMAHTQRVHVNNQRDSQKVIKLDVEVVDDVEKTEILFQVYCVAREKKLLMSIRVCACILHLISTVITHQHHELSQLNGFSDIFANTETSGGEVWRVNIVIQSTCIYDTFLHQ